MIFRPVSLPERRQGCGLPRSHASSTENCNVAWRDLPPGSGADQQRAAIGRGGRLPNVNWAAEINDVVFSIATISVKQAGATSRSPGCRTRASPRLLYWENKVGFFDIKGVKVPSCRQSRKARTSNIAMRWWQRI